MGIGIHPFILIAIAGAFAALVAIILAFKARSGVGIALLAALALVCLVPAGLVFVMFHPELVDARFRTYKRFYHDIEIGMTREQVLAAMDRFYPASGLRKRPSIMEDTPDRLGFFMNPETSREPNCEGIFLTLENDKVTKKTYSPD